MFFFPSGILSAMLIKLLALLISERLFRHFSVRIVSILISQYSFSYHTNVIEAGSVHSILLSINFFALFLYCNVEFFDNGATCYTPLASESTFSIVLRTYTPHCTHTRRSPEEESVKFWNVVYVYCGVCVFKTLEKPFYLRVICVMCWVAFLDTI